jgi:integrase
VSINVEGIQEIRSKREEGRKTLAVSVPLVITAPTSLSLEQNPEAGFEIFWGKWPLKQGRAAAWKAWQKIAISEYPAITAGLQRWRKSEQWARGVIPHPATWLNGKALTPDQERALLAAASKSDSACYTATVLALNSTMRSKEIKSLRWEQIDFVRRELVVGESKTDAGAGRLIPLNPTVFEALVRWAGLRPSADPSHFVFPWCENRKVDPTRPTKGWRTAWRNALKQAGFKCRFHDLRHTTITKLAEGQASDQTIMSIAGHVSKEMMERYSHIRTEAKRRALDAIAQTSSPSVFEDVVHQNVHQIEEGDSEAIRKPLN